MNSVSYFLRLIDYFQEPFYVNFEEGLVTQTCSGRYELRDAKDPLKKEAKKIQ